LLLCVRCVLRSCLHYADVVFEYLAQLDYLLLSHRASLERVESFLMRDIGMFHHVKDLLDQFALSMYRLIHRQIKSHLRDLFSIGLASTFYLSLRVVIEGINYPLFAQYRVIGELWEHATTKLSHLLLP
jgi:hypothetical protein